ncbi:MAG: hypothetical protein ACXW1Y_08485 [Acidimicrobiia bacterium]
MIASGVQPITTRPAGPISTPAEVMAPAAYWLRDAEHTWAPSPYRLEDDCLRWGPLWRFRAFAVAPRVYLHELRRLDLRKGAQLLDFCNQFGALGIQRGPGTSLPLDEVRYAMALIRTLTSIYHLHETGQFSNESIREWKWDAEWVAPPVDAITGHEFFTHEMNLLLDAVTPMVGFGNHQQRPNTLLDVLAIQLFNDIAGGVTYKTCANQSCRELFVNQINRKAKRRSRTNGAIYCSPRCSKAQAQRNYRQRSNGHGA